MQARTRRTRLAGGVTGLPVRPWLLLLCGCVAIAFVQRAGAERHERLLHLTGSVLLLGYPEDDTLYVTRDGEELTLQPPGPNRAGHPTYPSLSRDGTLVATSYVKSPYPRYREGIAIYSLATRRWTLYDGGDFHYVWATALSPDGSTVAFKAERHWSQPRQLLILDLQTGDTTVLAEPYLSSAALAWSPDGRQFVVGHPVRGPGPSAELVESELRIRGLGDRQERRLVSGSNPSWSPSGEWIAYLDPEGAVAMIRPDGTGATTLARLRRRPLFFSKRYLVNPPVWSPDSTALLLHEFVADETARTLIHQFDLEPRTLRRKTGAGVAVLGWSD